MPNEVLLKERMREIGITQKEVARMLGVAQPTLCLKIKGLRPFYLTEAEKLADILEIPDSNFGDYFFNCDLRSAK